VPRVKYAMDYRPKTPSLWVTSRKGIFPGEYNPIHISSTLIPYHEETEAQLQVLLPKTNEITAKNNRNFYTPWFLASLWSEFPASSTTPLILPTSVSKMKSLNAWEHCSSANISNNRSFRLKHPGVPDGSDGSDGTSYPLTENYTLPVAQATGRIA